MRQLHLHRIACLLSDHRGQLLNPVTLSDADVCHVTDTAPHYLKYCSYRMGPNIFPVTFSGKTHVICDWLISFVTLTNPAEILECACQFSTAQVSRICTSHPSMCNLMNLHKKNSVKEWFLCCSVLQPSCLMWLSIPAGKHQHPSFLMLFVCVVGSICYRDFQPSSMH